MKIFYGKANDLLPDGFTFRNARFFENVMPDAKEVVIDGDYPEIEEAYRGADVPVSRIDKVAPVYTPAPGSAGASDVVSIPADWRNLPWTQPDERGLTLRGLASDVSTETIRSKEDAFAAIEAYLAGDLDKPLADAGGLSRRELNADLEVLGLEIEPDEAPADTVSRIADARHAEGEESPE